MPTALFLETVPPQEQDPLIELKMSTDETTKAVPAAAAAATERKTEAVPAAAVAAAAAITAQEENPCDKMDSIDDSIVARLHEKMIDDPILAKLHEKIKEDLRLEMAAPPKSKKVIKRANKIAIALRKAAAETAAEAASDNSMEIKADKIIKNSISSTKIMRMKNIIRSKQRLVICVN